jgi:hypothetical protein
MAAGSRGRATRDAPYSSDESDEIVSIDLIAFEPKEI